MLAKKRLRTCPEERADAATFADTDFGDIELSRDMRDELLNPAGWEEVLGSYSRTTGLAVALADVQGRQLGPCYNPQPAWSFAQGAMAQGDACSFCLARAAPCNAVRSALQTGRVEITRDGAGMVHVAAPLSLGKYKLGALLAGQVFDRYPEPLPLQRLARDRGISEQQLWREARNQLPIRTATLQVYGELLLSLGRAILRQRYAAILERNLGKTNRRLRLFFDGVKDHAIFTLDGAGCVTSWNRGAEHILGHTENEIIGKDFARFFTPDDIQKGLPGDLLRRARQEVWVEEHGWQVRRDGTRFFAESSLTLLEAGDFREFGRVIHDVTERRESQHALLQAQKLESIGVLASGIAHDFNNLLSGILGGISFAKSSLPPDHPIYASLAIAEHASEKAADLTHQLLAYGGQGKFVVTQFDLSTLIREMLELLRASIPTSTDLQVALESDLPWIEADASQIQQVVMNLVINGAEAIGLEAGWLRVSTGIGPGDSAGNEVYMEVRDSGSGMTEETKARIFDPFFTTKFTGRGLGLAAVSGIVAGHKGRMRVESAPGTGSTFRIWFPAVEKRAPRNEPPPVLKQEPASGTVLVVDDEPALRMLAQAILEQCGYEVLVAEDGRQAVEVFRRHADSITAILLDMTMPVMSGAEAFSQIRAVRADVPIVVSTGYSEATTRELFTDDAMVGFVQKPYTAARLCERIRTTSASVRAMREAAK